MSHLGPRSGRVCGVAQLARFVQQGQGMDVTTLAYLLALVGQPAAVNSPSGVCEALVVAPARALLVSRECVPGLASWDVSIYVGESEESESETLKLDGNTVRWEVRP